MYKIYILDDEKDLLMLTKRYLEKEGYIVKAFSDAHKAIDAVGEDVSLWLLDIMLDGDLSGYDVIKEINEKRPAPVIFMSARNQEIDRIMGLELGSDDYITKPFSMREMVLRVNNVIKRTYKEVMEEKISYGNYVIDKTKRTILNDGNEVLLTSKETDLVLYLINNIDTSFTRDKLLNKVWGNDYFGSDRVVDDLVKRIRKKMPGFNIETIYGYGYRLKK
jgi:two-component system response regulator CssR